MRKSTAALLAIVAALAATSVASWRALVKERDRTEALQARMQPRDCPGVAATTARQAVPAADVAVKQAPTTCEDASAPDTADFDEPRLLQDAQYREAMRRFRILELTSGHVDLAKVLGISQEKADRLIKLLADRELRYLSKPHPNPRNEEEQRIRQAEIERSQQEGDAEIASLIGEARLSEWKDYQQSLGSRHDVYQLGANLFAIGHPLREDQVEPLIAAIHEERKRVDQKLRDYTASLTWSDGMEVKSHGYRDHRRTELLEAADERIRASASDILSPAQFAVFEDMLRRSRELDAARQQMWRAQSDAARFTAEAD